MSHEEPAPTRVRAHMFPQIWLLLICLTAFGFFVAVDQRFLQSMLEADQSRLSIFIFLIFIGATMHAAWHIFSASRQIEFARRVQNGSVFVPAAPGQADKSPDLSTSASLVRSYIAEIAEAPAAAETPSNPQDDVAMVVEIYADRLRSAVDIGWYVVDILIRLGLVGTIVGFILILGTLAGGANVNAENIQSLLISMSGGMGIALYTTLAGLITATLLGVQYMVLGRCVEHLIAQLILLSRNARPAGQAA